MTSERWRQVEELYHSALERNAEERGAFLDGACGVDQELRREVDSLLAHDESLLDRPAWKGLELDPGARLGPYEIVAKLGEGGMGVVYRAQDTKLNRPVAIKLLSDKLADAEARRRFQREAQTVSSLNHPHILTVYDVGEFGGRQYLVTEFVDGGTLREWASEEKRSWRQSIELLAGVADGLAAAHQAGIFHRDVKPDNILIAKSGYAKLADFGLAKLTESSGGDATRTLSEPGMIMGPIAYMSPEQASGRTVDARSDVFSFGVVLHELLAGHRPFTGSSDLEVLQKIIHAAPEHLNAEVPPALEAVAEKTLEKDPADRYQSMRELVVDLRRIARKGTVEIGRREVSQSPRFWAHLADRRSVGRSHCRRRSGWLASQGAARRERFRRPGAGAASHQHGGSGGDAGYFAGRQDSGVRARLRAIAGRFGFG